MIIIVCTSWYTSFWEFILGSRNFTALKITMMSKWDYQQTNGPLLQAKVARVFSNYFWWNKYIWKLRLTLIFWGKNKALARFVTCTTSKQPFCLCEKFTVASLTNHSVKLLILVSKILQCHTLFTVQNRCSLYIYLVVLFHTNNILCR